jgi:tetratricopeptide (TPR) repeat protein
MRSSMLGLAIVCASATALADNTAKAKHLYDEGLRHYQIAEYTAAIDAWKQAYLISKKPLLLFNIGQAYRLSGDCQQAMTFYENYQDAEAKPKNKDELDQAIAACKNAPKPETKPEITVTPPPPVAVTTVAPPPPAPEASGGHRGIGLIVAIGGVALEGVALAFALAGRSDARQAEHVTVWDQPANDLQSAGLRDNKLAWGLGIAGGVAIITGAVLYVTGGTSTEHGVAIAPTRGGAELAWSTSF